MDAQEIQTKIGLIDLYNANGLALADLVLQLFPDNVDDISDAQEPAFEVMVDLQTAYAVDLDQGRSKTAATGVLIQNAQDELQKLLRHPTL